jgi:hypothetical protein
MSANYFPKIRKSALGLLIAIFAVLFMAVSVAYAALYTISTTDNSVSEWFSQGVPVFQTDPAGDVATADEDIISTWVAAEDSNSDGTGDTINFLVEMKGSPALSTNAFRVVVASIDCNNNDVHQEAVDRLIIYNPTSDFVEIRNGTQTVKYGPPGAKDFGQRVNQYLEWGVPVSELGGGQFDEPVGHCSGEVGVRFATVNGLSGATIDQTTSSPWGGIRIPTAVSVSNFGAAGATFNSVAFVALAGLVIIGGLSGIILLRRRQ